jgi:uncharacterized protein YbbK (DUF523 family)/uncharacterized protein YbgA (DUF1722 family)
MPDHQEKTEKRKPRVGISSCLLGEKVRYDGGHKRHDWIVTTLAPWVQFVPYCPEIEMGFGVPRPTLRLVQKESSGPIELQQSQLQHDVTATAQKAIERLLPKVEDLDGCIFMKKSPSCGLERVPIYLQSHHGEWVPNGKGMGLFAHAVEERFPSTPKIDSGRLENKRERDVFLRRLWTWFQWKELCANEVKSVSLLQTFHAQHKYLMMEFSPEDVTKLGRLLATKISGEKTLSLMVKQYEHQLVILLKKNPTVQKRCNVLEHVMGYFKQDLQKEEKQQLVGMIQSYRIGQLPYMALMKLLDFLSHKYQKQYLLDQHYFSPYPLPLAILATEDHF